MVRIEHNGAVVATIERREGHILTSLDIDGQVYTSANWPHPNDEFYVGIARQCGFAPHALFEYAWQHEIAHSLLPWRLFGRHSYVVSNSARQKKGSLAASASEERLVFYFQRYAARAIPCIDPHWEPLRAEFDAIVMAERP